jgi:hypothetical protein
MEQHELHGLPPMRPALVPRGEPPGLAPLLSRQVQQHVNKARAGVAADLRWKHHVPDDDPVKKKGHH